MQTANVSLHSQDLTPKQQHQLILQMLVTLYGFRMHGDGDGSFALNTDAKLSNLVVMKRGGPMKVADLGNNVGYTRHLSRNFNCGSEGLSTTKEYCPPEVDGANFLGMAAER